MVSLPPMNPNSASHVEPKAVDEASTSKKGSKPEAVRFMLGCWAAMIFGELVHQILQIVGIVLDPAPLREASREAARGQEGALSESVVDAAMWSSVAIMALIQLAILAMFTAALMALNKQKRWAPNARRLLQIFSIFFGLRGLALFMMRPTSTAIPMALYGFDGVVQILVAVAGGLGVFYASQKESIQWSEAGVPPEQRANRGQGPLGGK